MFVHHVFFWLKEGLSEADIQLFENSIKTLPSIEGVQLGEVGKPAATNRPVIDRSYSYSLLLVFAGKAGHDAYQPHPVHQKFVDSCAHLWSRIQIYDAESL